MDDDKLQELDDDAFLEEIIRSFHEEERHYHDRVELLHRRLENCSDEDREKIEAVLETSRRQVRATKEVFTALLDE